MRRPISICLRLAPSIGGLCSRWGCVFQPGQIVQPKPVAGSMPVTASSGQARELFRRGWRISENLHLERCNEDWRATVKEDQALRWHGPGLRSTAEPGRDQRGSRESEGAGLESDAGRAVDDPVDRRPAGRELSRRISAMNDLLAMFPKDKHLLYLAGNWLMLENGNEQAQKLFERALAVDKNYPARSAIAVVWRTHDPLCRLSR